MTPLANHSRRPLLPFLAALVLATLAILSMNGQAQAAPAPDGSYRQSCRNVSATPRVLTARCQTKRGNYIRARLEAYVSCQGDIANVDGRLICRPIPGDIVLYDGSYYRGRALPVNGDIAALPRAFDDRTSSIRLRRGAWQVCTDRNYRGRCQTIRADVQDLNRLRLNNNISSLRRVFAQPQGSYQQSCRNVEFDGRILTADCRDRRNRWESSDLDTRTCRRDADIFNRNGELSCDDRRRDDGDRGRDDDRDDADRDPGRTERDRDRDQDQDRDRDDGDRDRGDRGDRGDRDQGGRGDARLPDGSYQQTCRGARLDQRVLSAECQDRSGAWRRSTLNIENCRRDIGNDNGVLTCGSAFPPPPKPGTQPPPPAPPPAAPPPPPPATQPPPAPPAPSTTTQPPSRPLPAGSYQQSCRNADVARGTLTAECKTSSGEWRSTSLNIRTCAQGVDIANDNGALKCAVATPPSPPAAPPPPASTAPPPPPPATTPPPAAPTPPPPAPTSPPTGVSPPPPANDATVPQEVAPPAGGTPPQAQRQPPEGSYQKTCRNASVERGTLKAECQDATGAYKETSIALRTCRGADIANEGGVLKCAAPPP